jgi:ParB family chromosome partitioning protein
VVKRAKVTVEEAEKVLTPDFLDRVLEQEGLANIVDIPLDDIDPNPFQTREHFDEQGLAEMAQTMSDEGVGVFGPVVTRRVGERYQLAYGERRLRAARIAGLQTFPVVIRDLEDTEMALISLVENVQRKEFEPIEEARAYRQIEEMGMSRRQLAKKVGKSPGHITDLVALLREPSVAQAVQEQGLDLVMAREIAKVEDTEARDKILQRAVAGELDRAAVKREARRARQRYDPLPELRTVRKKAEAIQLDMFDQLAPTGIHEIRSELEAIVAWATGLLEKLGS